MNIAEIKERMNKDSHEPCTHKGCMAHKSHPCEVCRRQNINGAMVDPDKKWLVAEVERLRGCINELGILIKTKDWAFEKIVKRCDALEKEKELLK